MAQHVYECMFILDSNRYARDSNGVSGKLTAMIENCDGEVLASRLWNEQRLAYPIRGQHKGTYWLSYFRMDSQRLSDFERLCKLNDGVLRNLTLKVEPRLVDALVAHAQGKDVPPASDDKPTEKPTENATTDNSTGDDSEKESDNVEETAKVEAT